MKVIGAGLGRTGTYSLKLALERLGFGPCYHMETVLQDPERRISHWNAVLAGNPNWERIFDGFQSVVDWPAATFYIPLRDAYPEAKFILTTRSAESWADSYGATISKLIEARDEAPEPMQPWLDMANDVLERNGIFADMSREELIAQYSGHVVEVKSAIPKNRLLVFEVREGWEPLCAFLEVSVPDEPFPRSNDRSEFWDMVAAGNTPDAAD
tara:strand:+ start:6910 stop:7545 length:636 start_codon:yes stop_codon:yes gene_type:complete